MARVELEQILKRYPNGFEAVKGISLDIQHQEFVVLVGPSGCGKSTTLRMVAGLESITSGALRINGARVNELPPKARGVAMVFQSYALYPHMTVFENMAFGLKLQKLPLKEIKRRVGEVAERLGLTELLDRKPKEMSGGQRQRVAMGRAIVRKPRVFLFDEPLSNLDAKLRLQMRVEVGRLHQSLGATTLYVTHDQVEAMTLADRICLLKDGVVQQLGPPLTLFHEPANLFVATFIGSPPMNLLNVSIEEARLKGEGFSLPIPKGLEPKGALRLGIRPQHLRLSEAGPENLSVQVEVVEPQGYETFVYCRYQGEHLGALVGEGEPCPKPGETVHLSFNPQSLHLFDLHTERRL